jgi:hypothetical protein
VDGVIASLSTGEGPAALHQAADHAQALFERAGGQQRADS